MGLNYLCGVNPLHRKKPRGYGFMETIVTV